MNRLSRIEQPHGLGPVDLCWQNGSGTYLVSAGTDSTAAIYTRNGKLLERISLPGICVSMEWDRDGDLLALTAMNSHILFIWDSTTHRKYQVDCGLRDSLNCVLWCKSSHTLAVTTTKGNLCIYNHMTNKRIPVLGKHSKAITCGKWNSENLLALGSEDKTISISNIEGDTLKMIALRAEPSLIAFSTMKGEERTTTGNTISVIIGHRTLFLYNLQDPENPVELAFQSKYGNIVAYEWYGDGYILIGFSEGYITSISTHLREIGHELFQAKNHKALLNDLALSPDIGLVATCGDNTIKVHDLGSLPETVNVVTIDDDTGIDKLSWSKDGQLLAVATNYGSIHLYLSKLPMIASVYNNYTAVLTSLSQVTIYVSSTVQKNKISDSVTVETEIEPTFLSIGPSHLIFGMNNRAWFYTIEMNMKDPTCPKFKCVKLLMDKEYLGSIIGININAEYVSVLFEGKLHLHFIDSSNSENDSKIFSETDEIITSHQLTTEFLMYSAGEYIKYFSLEDWKECIKFRHECKIKSINASNDSVRCAFIDANSNGYVFNPVKDGCIAIPNFPTIPKGIKWETWHNEKHTFIAYDSRRVYVYVYHADSINGEEVRYVGDSKLSTGYMPLQFCKGEVICETANGQLSNLLLSTHQISTSLLKSDSEDSFKDSIDKLLALQRYDDAWNLCLLIDSKEYWTKFAITALTNLNIEKAILAYSNIDEVGMVLSLMGLKYVEDKNLIKGKICMLLENFDEAQDFYLQSSDPIEALRLRQDLLQWDIALELAKNLAPNEIPNISREYAQQLELTGRGLEALNYYENGLMDESDINHVLGCYAGIARTSIKCGDHERALKIAFGPNSNKTLKNDCALLFENIKKLKEAAALYEAGENYNDAASCYIRLKNWNKLSELLTYVSSSKIHAQYAKAMEGIGNYKKAVTGYELARDYDNMIRVTLDHLNDAQDAVRIVQNTRSIEGAKMIARYFNKTGDILSALRYLVMSACYEEALKLAKQHKQLELYGSILVDETIDDEAVPDFVALAEEFENCNQHLLAGKFYFHGKLYKKAINHLLIASQENPENEDVLTLSIDVVASANDDLLTNRVIELLLGEIDGIARDPKFVFRLYMAKKEYKQAAKTAVIIATEEQLAGNYRQAHDILMSMCIELKENSLKISWEMMGNLMLLHSYILVRLHVKLAHHTKAALLLKRIADNISKFPTHAAAILTSAVIECHRANLKLTAFTYASILMKPEYRNQIDGKYAKRIEAVVRKAPRGIELTDQIIEEQTPCPYCNHLLPYTQLTCTNCHSTIPFCIATGWHITASNLTSCPNCNFPALHSELVELLKLHDKCPMCNELLNRSDLIIVKDVDKFLNPLQ